MQREGTFGRHLFSVTRTCVCLLPLCLALPASMLAGSTRFARIAELEGKAELQLRASDAWQPAVRNMSALESSWLRTSDAGRLEIEFDEGSALRLVGDSQAEISDYSRLSTGQRVTLLSLDHGLAYFTGEPHQNDSLSLALPGLQATLRRGSRVRLEANPQFSFIAVIEGAVRVSTPATELDLREGQVMRVDPNASGRFSLFREIPEMPADWWSEDRDKAAASTASAKYLNGAVYGAVDLDRNGVWISGSESGPVWKPKGVGDNWVPFRDGRWRWYDEAGYTWISAEPWGWAPYHYGRWIQNSALGWVWAPGTNAIFKPGEVYWMRGTNLAGWGPLAPGETWTGNGTPLQYAALNSTFGKFSIGMREIEPSVDLIRARDVLTAASFTAALPSPPFVAARLDAIRPALRAGSTHVVTPVVAGDQFDAPSREAISRAASRAASDAATQAVTQIVEPPLPAVPPVPNLPASLDGNGYNVAPEPVEIFYPVPIYTGIVVINPPEHRHFRDPAPPAKPPDKPPVEVVPPIHRVTPGDGGPVHNGIVASHPRDDHLPKDK